MTATFSPEEAARLAAFEAAPDAPESYAATVERMARAMWEADNPDLDWEDYEAEEADDYRRMATVALRVVTEPVDPT